MLNLYFFSFIFVFNLYLNVLTPCLQVLIFYLQLDPVYWCGFHLSLLFDLVSFSFPEFQSDFFFRIFLILIEFLFHVCIVFFISFSPLFEFSWNSYKHLFVSSLKSLIVLIIIL
jgi:hypothetical protein